MKVYLSQIYFASVFLLAFISELVSLEQKLVTNGKYEAVVALAELAHKDQPPKESQKRVFMRLLFAKKVTC